MARTTRTFCAWVDAVSGHAGSNPQAVASTCWFLRERGLRGEGQSQLTGDAGEHVRTPPRPKDASHSTTSSRPRRPATSPPSMIGSCSMCRRLISDTASIATSPGRRPPVAWPRGHDVAHARALPFERCTRRTSDRRARQMSDRVERFALALTAPRAGPATAATRNVVRASHGRYDVCASGDRLLEMQSTVPTKATIAPNQAQSPKHSRSRRPRGFELTHGTWLRRSEMPLGQAGRRNTEAKNKNRLFNRLSTLGTRQIRRDSG